MPKPKPNPTRRPPLQAALSLSCVGLLTRRRALPRLLCALALLLLGVDLFLRLNAGVTRSLSRSLSPEPKPSPNAQGFGRKGAALHGQGRFDKAIAAYEDGLKI